MDTEPERFFYLDQMRGVLMILGIFLHSAQVFNPEQYWLIFSEYPSNLASYVIDVIRIFRMPTFFVVSGFFCTLLLKKYQVVSFMKNRCLRIGVPLIATALILNSIQELLLVWTGFQSFEFSEYLRGGWISHLWFLINLVIYYAATIVIALVAPDIARRSALFVSKRLLSIPVYIWIILLPFVSIAVIASNKLGLPLYSNIFGVLHVHNIVGYMPYFVFGMLLGSNLSLAKKFTQTNLYVLIFMLIISALTLQQLNAGGDLTSRIVEEYFYSLSIWLSASLCFVAFYKFFNHPSIRARNLSNSSYTIYLFHHLYVIVIGLLMINFSLPIFEGSSGLLLLIVVVFLLSYFTHSHIIERSKIMRFLFNGKT